MTLTADQYFQISQGYAQAAADPYVSREGREAFAHKAEWFDFLGRRRRGLPRRELLVGATVLSQLAFWLANLAIQNSRDDQGDRSLLRFASPARRSTSLAHCCSRMLSICLDTRKAGSRECQRRSQGNWTG